MSTAQNDPTGRAIDVSQLSFEQLQAVHQGMQNEIQQLTQSFGALRLAIGRFKSSEENLTHISPDNEGKEILVPLTSSLYIPGKLTDIKKVIVEVGGNFYVEKDIKDAKSFITRKIEDLEKRVGAVRGILAKKNQDFQVVTMMRNARAQEALASQAKKKS
ncbi:hypothetical protein AAMO2058_001314900 [Amorphochlora amoebiformis]